MVYLTAGLAILVLILTHACRRLWIAAENTGLRDWAFSLEQELQVANKLLCEQDIVLSQVGELFDHAGVDLEDTEHTQASKDLKLLGSILRSRMRFDESPFSLSWAQEILAKLGDRYGIEPTGRGPYDIRVAVRIGEGILESVLAKRI